MKYIPLPRPGKLTDYTGEFDNLDLASGRFQLPEQLSKAFWNRNQESTLLKFHAFPITDGGMRYVSLFDPKFVESDKSGNLSSGAYGLHVMIPDSEDLIDVGSDFMKYLNLTDRVSVEGYGQVVRLWNPGEFEEYLGPGVEFNGDLEEFQRKCMGKKA